MIDITFNENQQFAVNWQNGPLLVLAGPGSGKTSVLTFRIARMLEESPSEHFKILALTFTNKAAAEMNERISKIIPDLSGRTLLTTFHSFSAEVLRQHGHHIGLKPDFTILASEDDRLSLIDDSIDGVESSGISVEYSSDKLLPAISRLLDRNIEKESALDYLKDRNVYDAEIISEVYKNYRIKMIENSALDFGGLIAETLNLLKIKKPVRNIISKIYPYICVDEFQDTNLLQYELLKLLVNEKTRNLFVVADDDQIIYQWRGASPKRLINLTHEYDMNVVQLPENYRCPSVVIDLANKLIVNNQSRSINKNPLVAVKKIDSRDAVRLEGFDDFEDEVEWVAKDIEIKSPLERSKSVIISRTRKLLESMVDELQRKGMDAYIAVRKDEFVSSPLRWLHASLRLANARQDKEQLSRMCKSFYDLEGIFLNPKDIVSDASTMESDYLRALVHNVTQREELEPHTKLYMKNSLRNLVDKLNYEKYIKDSFEWFDKVPIIAEQSHNAFTEFEEEKSTWEMLYNEIESLLGKGNVTLNALLQELDLRSKTPPHPKQAVPCFTIHATKGMEFKHVYIIGMVEDQLPSWSAIKKGDNSHEMQEERRNCFVAITRTQETLTMTYSDELDGWQKQPSRFLEEMELI